MNKSLAQFRFRRFLGWFQPIFDAFKFGRTATTLVLLVFAIVPFQKPLFHKALKNFSLSIIPANLVLPSYFSFKLSFFLSDLLLILLFICILRKGKWADFFWSGPSKYLTLLLVTALFSLGASSTSHYLLMYVRFIQIALVAVLFNSIRTLFHRENIGRFLKSLAVLLFALSLFESLIAIAQYFSQDRVGLSFLGEQGRTYFAFPMPGGSISLLDSLFHIHRKSEILLRSNGTFPHPNIFGGFQFCALLAAFYLYFVQDTKKYKLWIFCGIFIQILALTVSFSRAAIIASFFSTLLYFLFLVRFPERRKAIKELIFLLAASSALCLVLFYPQLFARGGIVNYNEITQGADTERLVYQQIALDMIKERPLLGVGLNNFQIESHRFFPDVRIFFARVHNIYLLIAAETGLIGASFFLLFFVSILRNIVHCLDSQQGLFLMSLFVGLLFMGACDFYFICRPHGRILFFGIAALLFSSTNRVASDETSYCSA